MEPFKEALSLWSSLDWPKSDDEDESKMDEEGG